jgi:hypothetical protein
MFSAAYKKRLATALAGAALASAMVVSGASADPFTASERQQVEQFQGHQDLRSPDAVDAARAAGDPPDVTTIPQSGPYPVGAGYEDLRTPEAEPVAGDPSEPAGFDLVSAAIGAVAAAGLALVLMATLGTRRPSGRRPASA